MQVLGTWELWIVVVLATVLTWRVWPRSWRVMPRVRFSTRWLMVAVLALGLILGVFARWYAREDRRRALIDLLHVQQQVTNAVLHQARAEIAASGRKNFSFLTEQSFHSDRWAESLDAFESPDGRKQPLIFVKVTGACDDLLRPVTIRPSGAPLEGPLLDKLTQTYRARGWRYEVVPLPAAAR